MSASSVLPRNGVSGCMIRLFARRIDTKSRTRTILLFTVTEEGEVLGSLECSIQKDRLGWPEVFSMLREVRDMINRSGIINSQYFYRTSPSISYMKRVLRRVFREGSTEVEAVKIPVSKAEADLAEYLKNGRFDFRWKTYIDHKYLVDFLIFLGKRKKIVLDIAQACENIDEVEKVLSERRKYLVKRGYLYYWVTAKQLDTEFSKIVETLENIIEKKEVRPPGPLTAEVKMRTPSIQLLLKLEKEDSILSTRYYVILYRVRRSLGRKVLGIRGKIKIEKDIAKFAQELCNTLFNVNYYYSYLVEDYRKLYSTLINNGEITISVNRIYIDFRDVMIGKTDISKGGGEVKSLGRKAEQNQRSEVSGGLSASQTLMVEKIKYKFADRLSDDFLREVVSKTTQLLRQDQSKLESIPLENVRSFIEDYILKMRPLSGEGLEKLISCELIDRKKKRTVIGRMIKKAFLEIVENRMRLCEDAEHGMLNDSRVDV